MDRKVCFAAAACCTIECPMEHGTQMCGGCKHNTGRCEDCMFLKEPAVCPEYTKGGEDE